MTIYFKFSDQTQKELDDTLYAGIDRHREKVIQQNIMSHNVILYDGEIIRGGMKGHIIGENLYFELMWIDESLRGQNHGRQLLEKVEQEADARGVKRVYVDTAAYEAPEFYRACGYQVIATIPGYFDQFDRIFFRKDLA